MSTQSRDGRSWTQLAPSSLPLAKGLTRPICARHVIVLTDEHPKSLPNRSDVCLVIALRPEVLCEGEGILRGEQAFVPLVDRESDHRQVVKRVHSKPV